MNREELKALLMSEDMREVLKDILRENLDVTTSIGESNDYYSTYLEISMSVSFAGEVIASSSDTQSISRD